MSKRQEITDVLTPEGAKRISVGEVLVFEKNGEKLYLKVTKKLKGRVWAREVELFHPDQIDVIEKS